MMGGGMGFGRPGTREIVHRTENEEIRADDARGLRVILLNVIIVCLIMVAVMLLGPVAPVVAIPAALILSAAWVSDKQSSDNTAVTVWAIALALSAAWILAVDSWWWERIVDWYPIKFILPWWAILPAWLVIGAILWGVLDTRKSHHQSLANRNWPPTYSQMRPECGPYYAGGEDGSADEPLADDKAEIMAALAEVIAANQAKPQSPQFVDRITPVIASTSQAVGAVVPFDPSRLVRTNGEVPVRLADIERFCAALDARGATYEAWAEWHYDKWHSVICFCAQLGITTEPKPRSRTRAQKSSADALAMLYSMYPKSESNPPAPPKTDSQSVILNGRGVDRTEQNTEGG